MPYRRSHLRLLPQSAAPAVDPLHVVHAEPSGQTGWTRVEVWRRGDLIAIGEARSDALDADFVRGLAAFWLGDRDAVVIHGTAVQTGT